ncbi:hypothetical protein FRB91_000045 [Serendipita sp. 411]|nr:hypothetical protein FRB91_000045 [Serendipita sp. 411]
MGCSTTTVSSASLLDRVLKLKINKAVVDYLVSYVCSVVKLSPDVVSCPELGESSLTTTDPLHRSDSVRVDARIQTAKEKLPDLGGFIQNIALRSRCTMSTMVVTLIYLNRLDNVIRFRSPASKACSRHRIAFSTIMIAHKMSNDSSMVGKHWAEVSNMFTSSEVLDMEREMLQLLRYDLEVSLNEIWDVSLSFMATPLISLTAAEKASLAFSAPAISVPPPYLFADPPPTYLFVDYSPQIAGVAPIPYSFAIPNQDDGPLYDVIHPYSSLSIPPSSQYSTSTSISPLSLHVSPIVSPFLHPLPAQVPSPTFLSLASSRSGSSSSSSSSSAASSSRPIKGIARSSRSVPSLSGTRISTRSTKSLRSLTARTAPATVSHSLLKAESSRLKKKKHSSTVQPHRNITIRHPYSSRRPLIAASSHHSSPSTSSTSVPPTPLALGQGKTKSSINLAAAVTVSVKSPIVWYTGPEYRFISPTLGCDQS